MIIFFLNFSVFRVVCGTILGFARLDEIFVDFRILAVFLKQGCFVLLCLLGTQIQIPEKEPSGFFLL